MFLWGIAGLAFLAITVILGWALVMRLKIGLSSLELMAAAPIVGIVVTAWLCLLVYLAVADLNSAIAAAVVIIILALAILQPWKKWQIRPEYSHLPALAVIVLAASFFIYTGILNFYDGEYHIAFPFYGDAAFHSSLVTSFSEGHNYLPQYPIMAGQPLHYTFLIDFYSAALDHLGLGLQWSIVLVDIVLLSSLLALLYFFGCRFAGRKLGGILTVMLILLSGGLGFLQAYSDLQSSGMSLFAFLGNHNLNYTCNYDLSLVFTNFLIIVMAQRAALIGFAVGALILLLLYILYMEKEQEGLDQRALLLLAGVMAGLLPLFHTYSYACVMLSTVLLFMVFREKRWHYFMVPALLLALPQALFISEQGTQQFIRLQIGWMAGSLTNIPWFWINNMGLELVLLIAGLLICGRKRIMFYLPYLAIFIMANIIIFQPWDYDNHKFFSFWLMASAPLMALALLRVYDVRIIGKPLFALLLIFTVLTGLLVAIFLTTQYVEFPRSSIQIAGWITENTPPDSVFLTGDSATHPVYCLAGRKSYLGFYPWMYTHGVDTDGRVAIVQQIYGAENMQQALDLLKQNKIDYIYLGPEERNSNTYKVNMALFNNMTPVYNMTSSYGENYRIFKVPA